MTTAQSQVSKENLVKVEYYFVTKAKELGTNRIEATVQEIASGSGVALATAHKALNELNQRGVINKIKPSSRRFPIIYEYKGNLEGFDVAQTKDQRIGHLENTVALRDKEIESLKEQIANLQTIVEQHIIQKA